MKPPSKSTNNIQTEKPTVNLQNAFVDRYYDVTLAKGQSMGLLLALTYPVDTIISSSFSP